MLSNQKNEKMSGCFIRCLICDFWIDRENIQITPQGAGSSADDFCVCKTCYAKNFQQPASQPSNPITETKQRARVRKSTPTYRQPPKQ